MDTADPRSEHVDVGAASIPALGLGTWQNTGSQCVETVRTALELGYRHIDTAQIYDNEAMVGEGIARADVDRDEVFLTTKVWRSNLRYDDVLESVEASLDRLGVESVDLLLMHWPHPRVPVSETLDAMVELQKRDKVTHLGVANFTRSQLQAAIEVADAPLVTDQVLYNPLKDQSDLLSFCRDRALSLTAYSPIARGALIGDELLESIGARHDKTAVQVAIRWLLQQEGVIAIPKATSEIHLAENLAVFDFSLTDAEMTRIEERSPGLRRRLKNLAPAAVRRIPF